MNGERLADWYLAVVGGRPGVVATLVRALLAVASWGYALGLVVREATWRCGLMRPLRVRAKVVSVGNLTLGGTGKTPAVVHLAQRYLAAGERVAVLLRGHGARRLTGVNVVSDGPRTLLGVADAGDEAVLTARLLPGVPVLAGKDRRLTARAAVDHFGATVLLLDDGFQYRRLWVDEHIVLLDATQPFGTGRLFPAGTLRDPRCALRRAAQVWFTRTDAPGATPVADLAREVARWAPGVPVARTRHRPVRLRRLGSAEQLAPAALAQRRVVALAGIGNPRAFEATLASLGASVVARAFFPDHHRFAAAELAAVAAQPEEVWVVTTEKDAVRLAESDAWPAAGAPLWVLGIDLTHEPAGGADA